MQQSCRNCANLFEITEQDLTYYDRISPIFGLKKFNIPPPTHCPTCRQQRRYCIRNEHKMYERTCDLCKNNIISMYSSDKPFPIYCPDCWWGDSWHATNYAREINLEKPFFDQFRSLQETVPRISLYLVSSENCDYCNFVGDCKRCYLSFGAVYSEDCIYGSAYYSKDCVDNLVTRECEKCYELTDCRKLYNCLYCQDCYGSDHLQFCYDMQGCSECIACAGLRNKKFHIENKPYSQEEYENIRDAMDLCNQKEQEEWLAKLENIKLTTPRHFMPNTNTENVSGSHVYNSKNTRQSFFVDRCEDCSYCMQVVDLKDCYDNNYTEENELCNEYLGMYKAINTHFSTFSRSSYNVFYSEYSINAKNLFGCSNIRDREYCILNKQYTQEEYEDLVPKIIEQMINRSEWGEFFPITHSPFAYNETVAQEYFPIEKAEATSKHWPWKEEQEELPNVEKIIPADRLPEHIEEIPDDILNWAIRCSETSRPYKIIKQELDFYRKMHLPIPKIHPDERHKKRLNLRNPRKTHIRNCAKCSTKIQTTYSPDREETVLCEKCYLTEVY